MSHPPLHRGPAPKDTRWFGPKAHRLLQAALADLCWLLDRGYALRSAATLVGDRHCLTERQRIAVARCACTAEAARARGHREVSLDQLRDGELWLDGFNVLTILESALAGGYILVGRDGCCRDVAGLHRRYRKVVETIPALKLVAAAAHEAGLSALRWWLDQPVSNSGRLRALILDLARASGWPWEVEIVMNPDRVLSQADQVVATSDAAILDRCRRWTNLAGVILTRQVEGTRLVDLTLRLPSAMG